MEFSFLRMRCSHCHKHIYVQVPACTQGVLTVPPTLCYRKRSTNNVSCSLLRVAPQCPHSLVTSSHRNEIATYRVRESIVASSPGSPSPFLTFSRARILYAKDRRRGRAWYGTSATWPRSWWPLTPLSMYVHSTALALPSGPCLLH